MRAAVLVIVLLAALVAATAAKLSSSAAYGVHTETEPPIARLDFARAKSLMAAHPYLTGLAAAAVFSLALELWWRSQPRKTVSFQNDPRFKADNSGKGADYDVVIVGGGVVGGALAVTLGRQGKRVLVLEKTLGDQPRIVGELMQPGGLHRLEEMGLRGEQLAHCRAEHTFSQFAEAMEGIDAQPTRGYAILNSEKKWLHLSYTQDERPSVPKGVAQPYEGCGFHNGRLLAKMQTIAAATPKSACCVELAVG